MRTTMDSAGRVVIPKAMREAVGLSAGGEIEVGLVDGRIELDVPATPMRLERRGHGVVAVADREMPPLSAAQVRETLEQSRR